MNATLTAYVDRLQHEQSFRLLSESSLVSITDPDGTIAFITDEFARMAGFSVIELIGRNHNIVNSGHHSHEFWADVWKNIRGGGTWKGEVKNRVRNGGHCWLSAQISQLTNEEGMVMGYMLIGHDITARKEEEDRLELDRYKADAIFDHGADGQVLVGKDFRVMAFNRKARRMHELYYETRLQEGVSFIELISARYREEFSRGFNMACIGKETVSEQLLQQKDGRSKWFRFVYTPVYSREHEFVGVVRATIDIDRQRRAENDLREQKEQLQALIESIPDAIFFKDGDGRWLVTNSIAKKLFNLNGIDWVGKTEMELAEMQPDLRKAHEVCLVDDEKAWERRCLTIFHEFVIDEQGATHEYEVRKMPVFREDGSRKGLVIIGADISERRAEELELKQAKQMLEHTVRLAKVGGFQVDFKTNKILLTGVTRQITGIPDDYEPELEKLFLFYQEGPDREKMRKLVGRAIEKGEGFETDVRLVSLTGEVFWLRTIHVPEMEDGKCVSLSGYFQDITQQVQLREQKSAIEVKFKHLIEKSTDAIVLQDASGTIVYVSPSVEKILGYASHELIGTNGIELYHVDDRDEVLRRRQTIRSGPGKIYPLVGHRLLHKRGRSVYVQGTVVNLLEDEYVRAIVVHFRDVSEKHLMEQKLDIRNKRLDRIAWIFSHAVRGPVATILGLAGIFNHVQREDPVNGQIIERIVEPVSQLDKIIREVVSQTYQLELEKDEVVTKDDWDAIGLEAEC